MPTALCPKHTPNATWLCSTEALKDGDFEGKAAWRPQSLFTSFQLPQQPLQEARGQAELGAKREEEGRSRQGWGVVGRAWGSRLLGAVTFTKNTVFANWRCTCLRPPDGAMGVSILGSGSKPPKHLPSTSSILQFAIRVLFSHFYLVNFLLKACWQLSISLGPEQTPRVDGQALASPPAGEVQLSAPSPLPGHSSSRLPLDSVFVTQKCLSRDDHLSRKTPNLFTRFCTTSHHRGATSQRSDGWRHCQPLTSS